MSTKFLVRENTAFTPRASLIGPGQNAPPSFEENLKERSSFEQVGLECETLLSGSESSSARKTPDRRQRPLPGPYPERLRCPRRGDETRARSQLLVAKQRKRGR
jgi:hypothetical protein